MTRSMFDKINDIIKQQITKLLETHKAKLTGFTQRNQQQQDKNTHGELRHCPQQSSNNDQICP